MEKLRISPLNEPESVRTERNAARVSLSRIRLGASTRYQLKCPTCETGKAGWEPVHKLIENIKRG